MSKKKKPEPPAAPKPSPEKILEEANLDVLMEALAKVSGQMQGREGDELRRHVENVKGQVQSLVQQLQIHEEDQAARKVVAGEVERLVDAAIQTGSAAGKELEKHREPIAQAFRGMDLARAADALRLLADWMNNPTDEGRQKIEALVEQLKQTMGPLVGYDPEREEAERRAAIKKDVQASLDEIFRGKPKP